MSLFWAAFSVATLHTLLPAHWLPYVTVAKSNKSSVKRVITMTLTGTLLHFASTAALTALALLLSYGSTHAMGHGLERAGAGMLAVLGMVYLFLPAHIEHWSDKVTWFLAVGVGIQPCIELIPLILAASSSGPTVTLLVGSIWGATTLVLSLALVLCAYAGLTLGWTRWLAKYTYLITGGVLLLSAAGLFLHTH